jgi:hypothetical protein
VIGTEFTVHYADIGIVDVPIDSVVVIFAVKPFFKAVGKLAELKEVSVFIKG